jgi:hypothetical protein
MRATSGDAIHSVPYGVAIDAWPNFDDLARVFEPGDVGGGSRR